MRIEHWWNVNVQGKTEELGERLVQLRVSPPQITWMILELKPSLRSEEPSTNFLTYGMGTNG
jgi:hypothetical protein